MKVYELADKLKVSPKDVLTIVKKNRKDSKSELIATTILSESEIEAVEQVLVAKTKKSPKKETKKVVAPVVEEIKIPQSTSSKIIKKKPPKIEEVIIPQVEPEPETPKEDEPKTIKKVTVKKTVKVPAKVKSASQNNIEEQIVEPPKAINEEVSIQVQEHIEEEKHVPQIEEEKIQPIEVQIETPEVEQVPPKPEEIKPVEVPIPEPVKPPQETKQIHFEHRKEGTPIDSGRSYSSDRDRQRDDVKLIDQNQQKLVEKLQKALAEGRPQVTYREQKPREAIRYKKAEEGANFNRPKEYSPADRTDRSRDNKDTNRDKDKDKDKDDKRIYIKGKRKREDVKETDASIAKQKEREGKGKDGVWKTDKRKKQVAFKEKEHEKEKEVILKKKKAQADKIASIPKIIDIMETIKVADLAKKMNIKANELIAKLMSLGLLVTINQVIDAETVTLVAAEYNCETNIISLYDETVIQEKEDSPDDLEFRPPIVTVMGHVDHGKTMLLDAIRATNVVEHEAGRITQHIGAYSVKIDKGSVTFLDTPGHEAFTQMRARGAQVTDIVVLVVAADDGVMPQTKEAISHAKEAKVPIVVAINKIDSPKANIDNVKRQLADVGLASEDWGGETIAVEVSALKKMNIDKLLEAILLQAEMLELKANPKRPAIGNVVESKLDIGRGPVATVLIQNGTLNVGDYFVAGVYHGKVRALFDDLSRRVDRALPSTPIEVLGLSGVPEAGDPFNAVESEKEARSFAQKRQDLKRYDETKAVKKITLDDLSKKIKEGEIKEFKIVLKGDVQGSVEAIKSSLEKLSNDEVKVIVIYAAAGGINENDVNLSSASNAMIIGFNVSVNPKARAMAQREKISIQRYNVIYDAIDDIKKAILGILEPDYVEEVLGQAEVRELFRVPKIGLICGCYVIDGSILRNSKVRIYRNEVVHYNGVINSLKRFKDDVNEVKQNFECGIGVENFDDVKEGDIIEAYVIKEVARKSL